MRPTKCHTSNPKEERSLVKITMDLLSYAHNGQRCEARGITNTKVKLFLRRELPRILSKQTTQFRLKVMIIDKNNE